MSVRMFRVVNVLADITKLLPTFLNTFESYLARKYFQ